MIVLSLVATIAVLAAWDSNRRWASRKSTQDNKVEVLHMRISETEKVLTNHAGVLKQHDGSLAKHGEVITRLGLNKGKVQ
jgi:hypothetical protein